MAAGVSFPRPHLCLVREMRFAENMGYLTPEARQDYLAAIAALQQEAEQPPPPEATPAAAPQALEITAKRGASGEEKAELIYQGGEAAPVPAAPPEVAPARSPKPAAKKKT